MDNLFQQFFLGAAKATIDHLDRTCERTGWDNQIRIASMDTLCHLFACQDFVRAMR